MYGVILEICVQFYFFYTLELYILLCIVSCIGLPEQRSQRAIVLPPASALALALALALVLASTNVKVLH